MFVAFYRETMTPSTLTSSQQLELRQIVTVILCKSKSFVSRKRIGMGLMFVDGRQVKLGVLQQCQSPSYTYRQLLGTHDSKLIQVKIITSYTAVLPTSGSRRN